MDYYKYSFFILNNDLWRDILIYELGEIDFESFEYTDEGFDAYVQEKNMNRDKINTLRQKYNSVINQLDINLIKSQNWNAVWESNFEPVVIEDKLIIKAPFHRLNKVYDYEIEIQPKMSFGTGHHQTTQLISTFLLNQEKINTPVLDMGCGTGILAILATKLGAKEVDAIDIEEWAYENSIENAERNDCNNICFYCGGIEIIPNKKYGLILANINKNVLLNQMQIYYNHMEVNGFLVMSGFYPTDIKNIVKFGVEIGFQFHRQEEIDNWAMVILYKRKKNEFF